MTAISTIFKPRQTLILLIVNSLSAFLYSPLSLRHKVLGFGRTSNEILSIYGHEPITIPDTLYIEDLHYHSASGLLFGASEADVETRKHWFPP